MNKKSSLKAILATLFSAVLLTSCKAPLPEEQILAEYNGINQNVKKVEQNVKVSNGEVFVVSKDIVYDVTAGTKSVTTKKLNSIDSDEVYSVSTTTTNEDISNVKFDLEVTDFTSYELTTSNDLKAVVDNASINLMFGVDGKDVKGAVTVLFDATIGEKDVTLEKVVITYTSVNNNNVEITTSYTYKD